MKKIAIFLLSFVCLQISAQQTVAPASTPYYNFTTGIKLNGSYGSNGLCMVSTGVGTTWGACLGGLPGVSSDGNNGIQVQGTVAASTMIAPSANPLPSNIYAWVFGSSIDAGFNNEGDVYISALNGGSGYTGTGTVAVTVASGSCTTPPTVGATVDNNGALIFALTNAGYQCPTATFTTSISGFSTGSGASVTLTAWPNPYPKPWWLLMLQQPAFSGRVAACSPGYSSTGICATNHAASGSTLAETLSTIQTNSYTSVCSTPGYSNLFILDGANFANSLTGRTSGPAAVTADVAFGTLLTITHMMKSAGCKVLTTTVPPRGSSYSLVSSGTFFTQQTYANKLMRQMVQGVDYDYLIDWATQIPNYGALPYGTDQTHFTGIGASIVAQQASGSLSAGGGTTFTNSAGATGTFTNGLNVFGNGTNFGANSFAVGYVAGSPGSEYLSVLGNTTGAGGRNGFVLRTGDSNGSSNANILISDQNGTVSLGGGGGSVEKMTGGLSVQGTGASAAANSVGINYIAGTPGSAYFQIYGNTTGTGGRNGFVLQSGDSAGSNSVDIISADASGNVQIGTGGTVVTSNGGLSVTGTAAAAVANSVGINYASGSPGTTQMTVYGNTTGSGGRNGFVLKLADSAGANSNPIWVSDASGNVTVANGGGSMTNVAGGLRVDGTAITAVANSINLLTNGGNAYLSGNGPSAATRNGMVGRICDSAAANCKTLWQGDSSGNLTLSTSAQNTTVAGPLVLNSSITPATSRKGTFICTAGGTITVNNTNEAATSDVIISLNTAGGTISTPPAMKTVTPGTGFTVLCGASDTSTYNYSILN